MVVFATTRPLLRPGFGHCFVALETGGHWVTANRRAAGLTLRVAAPAGYDLAAFYRRHGFTVVETMWRAPSRARLSDACRLATCVGYCKALLGLRAPWVWTPYQLYRHLTETRPYEKELPPWEPCSIHPRHPSPNPFRT